MGETVKIGASGGSGVKAVVFDKDGVLADSEVINLRSAFEVFRAHSAKQCNFF